MPGRKYKVVCAKSPGFSLDASKNPQDKNKLIFWKDWGGKNQQWEFVPNEDNTFCIKSAASGGTLEIPDHSNAQKGTQPCVSQSNGTINEKWRILPA